MCSESQSESCGKSSRCALSLFCFSIDCTLWLHLLDIAAALKVAIRIRPTYRGRHAPYALQRATHRAPCVLFVHSLRRIRCVPKSCRGLGVAKLSSGIMHRIASRARCLRLALGCAFPITYARSHSLLRLVLGCRQLFSLRPHSSDLDTCCMVHAAHRVL